MTRPFTPRRCCLLPAVLWVLLAFPSLASAAEPIIDRFDSVASLTADGVLIVEETIVATVPGGGHGMFRDIPYAVRLPSGKAADTPPEVLSIAMDGVSLPPDDVENRGQSVLRVFMRDRSRTMAPGQHVFVVRYAMPHMVGFFDDHDELNWNVTGNLWGVPLVGASYTLYLPNGAAIKNLAAWLGETGSRESPVAMRKEERAGRPAAYFESRRAIWPGEGMTCAVSWQKGLITPTPVVASPADSLEIPVETPSAAPLAAGSSSPADWMEALADSARGSSAAKALAAFVWGYFFLVWWRVGKDPAKGTIIPRFHPPKAPADAGLPAGTPLSPAAVNYLLRETMLESRGLAAVLLSLAGRKACVIAGDGARGFTVSAADGTSPYPEERAVQEELSRNGALRLADASGERLLGLHRRVREELARTLPRFWTGNTGWLASGILLSWVSVFAYLTLAFGLPTDWPEAMTAFAVLAGMLAMGLPFVLPLLRRTPKGRRIPLALALLLLAGGLGLGLYAACEEAASEMPGDMLLAFGLVLLAPAPFINLMKAPSKEARHLLDECAGLALYITMAETERFRQFNPPQRTPELYTRLLPYAVAMNLEKAWGEHCADILESAQVQVETSDELGALTTSAIVHAIVRETEQAVSTYEARVYEASRSSAFESDGAGGRSGSGGGGGGGGFC